MSTQDKANSKTKQKKKVKKPQKQTFFYCNECEDVMDHEKDGQCKSCFQYNPEAMQF